MPLVLNISRVDSFGIDAKADNGKARLVMRLEMIIVLTKNFVCDIIICIACEGDSLLVPIFLWIIIIRRNSGCACRRKLFRNK